MNNDWMTNEAARLLDKQKYAVSLQNMTFLEAKSYFSNLIKIMKYDLESLKKQKIIWPAQCDSVIFHLGSAKALVQKLCEAFDHKPYPILVPTSTAARELVIQLYYAREQLDKLQELVRAFRPLCRASSKQAEKKRTTILRKLELFLLHGDDIIQNLAPLQEKAHVAISVYNASPLASVDQQSRQLAESPSRTFDPTLREKSRSHLVPVRDGYVEERDAPKQRLVEEEQPNQEENEQQEHEHMFADNTQLLASSTSDRACTVTGSCMPSSTLAGKQQDRDDLCDERPFCS